MDYEIRRNDEHNGQEVYFSSVPSKETREALKALKMRWHSVKKCWYGRASAEDIRAAIEGNQDEAEPFSVPASVFVDGGGLYDGYEGGNYRKWSSRKELKALILEDFKRAGIRATLRFGGNCYYTSLTCTLTVSPSEVKSFEEWNADQKDIYIKPNYWYGYIDGEGKHQNIFGEQFYALDPNAEETKELKAAIIKYNYFAAVESFKNANITATSSRAAEVLKPSALKRFELCSDIVNSYNRDCSNSQVDYFDRSIYDHYSVKVAG